MAVKFVHWEDQTPGQADALASKYYHSGYRFSSLSLYGTTKSPRLAAVMIHTGENPVVQRYVWPLNLAEMEQRFVAERNGSYAPLIISATGVAAEALFAAVWDEEAVATGWSLSMTAAEFRIVNTVTRFDVTYGSNNPPSATDDPPTEPTPLFHPGGIPISLSVYGDLFERRYAILLAPNTAAVAWDALGMNETPSEYQYRLSQQTADDKRPYLVCPTGDGHYASVFRDDEVGPYTSNFDMTASAYTQTVSGMKNTPYFPLNMQAAGSGSQVRFAVLAAKTSQITPRIFLVNGAPGANDQYDEAMQTVMAYYGMRQAALALVKGTQLVLARGYTYAEPEYPVVQPTTAFRIASCSKTFTSILIHQLLYANTLSLTDLVSDILDLHPPQGLGGFWGFNSVTVEQLLDMTSGIQGPSADLDVLQTFPGAQFPITEAQLNSWIVGQQLQGKPGTYSAWFYNTTGYVLLGQIVAKLTGSSFIDAVQQNISGPLGLQKTRLAVGPRNDQPEDEALYEHTMMPLLPSALNGTVNEQPLVPFGYGNTNFDNVGGGGGLSSSIVDMARVLAALSVATDTNPLLNPDEINRMFQAAARTTASLPGGQGTSNSLRAHGWDACWNETTTAETGNWYAQKGGNYAGAGAVMRLSMLGVSMALAVARQPVEAGPPGPPINGQPPYQTYPDFPAVTSRAEVANWGTADLFPTFGMPALA